MADLHPESTTDDVLGDTRLDGRRAIVTGASSGLGEETARALAARGALVTMAARNADKNAAAAERIRASDPDASLQLLDLDLADLASVRRFADQYRSGADAVDMLINNAGVMVCPFGHTADGFEMQFGTNHLGHFLLTALLADAVAAGDQPRVVTVSSAAHLISDVDLDDPGFETTDYDAWISYGRSKSANALFAFELAGRMADRGVLSYSVHPGMVATELARHMTEELMGQMISRISERTADAKEQGDGDSATASMPAMRTPAVGAATQVWAATSSDLADASGRYLLDCHVGSAPDAAPHISDTDTAARLWSLSEELVGQSFA
ncbi:MAG: SDR family NAD(P)-dependent oxidoreductase [Acidimicrobiales bacterium]